MMLNFESPINFNFTDKESVEFSSVQQCQLWAEQERTAWRKIESAWKASPLAPKKYRFDFGSQIKPYDDLYNACADAVSKGESEQVKPTLISRLEQIKSKLCVRASSAIGTQIVLLAGKDLLLALTTVCGLNPNFYTGSEWLTSTIGDSTNVESKNKFSYLIRGFANALMLQEGQGQPGLFP